MHGRVVVHRDDDPVAPEDEHHAHGGGRRSVPERVRQPLLHDPQHLFRVYPDKVVSLDGKLLARVRATEKVWWGEFLPPDEK